MRDPTIDRFSQHEVVHTAHLMSAAFDRWICQHRAVAADPELLSAAESVAEALGNFYQAVASRFSAHWE